MTIFVKQANSVPTLGPEDVIGFAKKPISILAEGLRLQGGISDGCRYLKRHSRFILISKAAAVPGGKSGPQRRRNIFIKNKQNVKLNRKVNYKFEVRPRSSDVHEIKVFMKRYQTSWWMP